MFCKKCGKELKDGAKFCPYCGTKVEEKPKEKAEEKANAKVKEKEPAMPSDERQDGPPKKSALPLIITLAAVAAVTLAVVAGIVLHGGKKGKTPALADIEYAGLETFQSGQDASDEASPEAPDETSDEVSAEKAVVRLPIEEVEEEVLGIRECWNDDREHILSGDYPSRNAGKDMKAYYNPQGELVMIESTAEVSSGGFAKTYEYRNGKLIFAFYEAADQQYRMYCKDEAMFRLDKRTGGDPVVLDAAYEDSEFLKWEKEAVDAGRKIYQNVINNPVSEPEMKLVSAAAVGLQTVQKLSYVSCGETSHQNQPNHDNTARAAMDGDEVTSWQEAAAGAGIGEKIWYDFGQEHPIRYISFKLGNWRNNRYYYANYRPRQLQIEIDGYTTSIEFPAEQEEYWVEIDPACAGKQISFTVEDVYKGTGEYEDTCIAEIGVYGE